jgi:paraquat-inducible protein A
LPDDHTARCGRCGARFYRRRRNTIQRALALSLASLVLFGLANGFTFMVFRLEGRESSNVLASGVVELYDQGLLPLAILVALVAIVIPLIKILGTLYVVLPLHLGRRPPFAGTVFRWVEILHPWAMMEVYMLGVLVAYVKLVDMATIELGTSLFAFLALILTMTATDAALEPHAVWERLRRSTGAPPPVTENRDSLVSCHACDLVCRVRPSEPLSHAVCPRCGAHLHRRKPDSLARTMALVLTAAILYIPANAFPVMTVISFGKGAPDTILSGIKELIHAGMWPLALLVFFASILVPMLKLLGLSYLLISVRIRSRWRLRDRTRLYRVIEGVGRWSMIDIFMISILIALVKLEAIATIEPGVGAIAFAGVVVVTMFASMCFDPRLMWDAAGANHDG